MAKVWLVTGTATGLGRHIGEAVLASGDRLVATARDPRRLDDLVEQHGDRARTAPLDVTDEGAAYAAVQVALDAFGHLDVVVNNAGYGDIAPFEQLSAERFKALVDTNFYGVVNVTRAALPIMRTQRSGCILQISSVGGRLALPGSAAYHATKWAVGGFTEALAQAVAPLGVTVCAIEPGGMRTDWGARENKDTPSLLADYEPSVGAVAQGAEVALGPGDERSGQGPSGHRSSGGQRSSPCTSAAGQRRRSVRCRSGGRSRRGCRPLA
jgi:NAD(P)-dependent dehydrogenase (short-subunit alcohol dehydrogenase family)